MTAPFRLVRAQPGTVTITLQPFRRWLPQLAEAVASVCEIRVEDLTLRRQKSRSIKAARQLFIFAAREVLGKSYFEIAEYIGCSCHSSAIAGHHVAADRRKNDAEFRQMSDLVNAIAAQLVDRALPQLEIQQEMFHDAQAA